MTNKTTIQKTFVRINVEHFNQSAELIEQYDNTLNTTDMTLTTFIERLEMIARMAGYEVPEGSLIFKNSQEKPEPSIQNRAPSDPVGVVINLFEKDVDIP